MPKLLTNFQAPGQPVDIAAWREDEDFPIHPLGSKPKRVVTCPADIAEPYLIPNHSYLFKIADGRRGLQLWSEVIAYRIAALAGMDVPPCFVAINHVSGEIGVLIEFFYGYPDDPQPSRLVHASDFLQRLKTGARTDRPHAVRVNLMIGRVLKIEDVNWWAQVLAFDALIGNTDRHPENWGWLVARKADGEVEWRLAPVFDNGTSLGWEIEDDRLVQATEPERIRRYIARGRHHCGWDRQSDSPTAHMELCRRFLEAYPEARGSMRQVAEIELELVLPILEECAQFDVGVSFTPARVRFVSTLIKERKRQLSSIVGA